MRVFLPRLPDVVAMAEQAFVAVNVIRNCLADVIAAPGRRVASLPEYRAKIQERPAQFHSLRACPSTNSIRILSGPSMKANLIVTPAIERGSAVHVTPSLRSFSTESARFSTLNPT